MDRLLSTLRWLFLDEEGDSLLKRYLKNALIVCPLASVFLNLAFGGTRYFLVRWAYGFLVGAVVSAVCHGFGGLVGAAERRIARLKGVEPRKRTKGRTFLISCSMMLPGLWLGFTVAEEVFHAYGYKYHARHLEDYGSGVLIGTLILGAVILAEMHRDAERARQQAARKVAELERKNLQAQISALTAQMNPHLLFNALNTIASLISTDPQGAEEMTERLADLYRGVLNSSRESKHSLATELGICRNYLSVERARYGDRLKFRLDTPEGLDLEKVTIPALTLQPLVENAIRHGIAPRATGGELRLKVRRETDRWQLTVEDDGVGYGKSCSRPGAGTGIANCRERLRLHYGERGDLRIGPGESGGTVARIEIPEAAL